MKIAEAVCNVIASDIADEAKGMKRVSDYAIGYLDAVSQMSYRALLTDCAAIIAAIPPEPVAVPEGWRLAPKSPSIAACIVASNAVGGAIDGRQCAVVYAAILAAEPQAEQPTQALTDVLTDFLLREMPAGTIIGDPAWWAKRIARVIEAKLNDKQPAATPHSTP